MNEGLNPIDLIFDASPAVQLVFLILLTLQVMGNHSALWLVLFAQKGVLSFEQILVWRGFSQLYKEGTQMQQEDLLMVGGKYLPCRFKDSCDSAIERRWKQSWAQRAMRVAYSREEKLERHLSFLATVGSFRRISACLVQ